MVAFIGHSTTASEASLSIRLGLSDVVDDSPVLVAFLCGPESCKTESYTYIFLSGVSIIPQTNSGEARKNIDARSSDHDFSIPNGPPDLALASFSLQESPTIFSSSHAQQRLRSLLLDAQTQSLLCRPSVNGYVSDWLFTLHRSLQDVFRPHLQDVIHYLESTL